MANGEITEGVSRELALQRAAQIRDLRYRLKLELLPGSARIKGSEQIGLKIADPSQPVILDFRDLDPTGKVSEGALSGLKVNDRSIKKPQQTRGHIVLPAQYFRSGENTIALSFETGVAPAGRPIIRYTDQDDGSEYLYTLFVPMDASLAFPCFDQPDLKGRFTLSLLAPDNWTVISNAEPEPASAAVRPGSKLTNFRETQPISTYLLSFAAGPFKQLAGKGAGVPLRLLVRQSKYRRAQEEWPEVMQISRDGMKHFVEFFGYRFPFPKYDQVLIPGFAYGGMEHAGSTFLREDSVLFRTTPNRSDRLARASLVLHEMAHQWFGDLVTMRWFDDLWLKEGFANYMASHAMAAIYGPDEIWKRFYQMHKPPAYGIDATKGTTPIYQEVHNLMDAKSAYGAIVYQKAPSLLRALSFLIGEDKFRDGVRLFLKEHSYGNAAWSDLIGSFEKTSNRKLTGWADAWVKQRGMPQVDVEWSCNAAGKIDSLKMKQRDVLGEGGLWPIKTRLLLAYDDAQPARINVQLESAQAEIPEAAGRKCPAYIFANDGDFGYGRFMLDERSRQAVLERIDKIKDAFQRTMLWGTLWDSVREAEMSPSDYLALALRSLPEESDEQLTESLLERIARVYQRYLPEASRAAFAERIEALCFDRMMNAKGLQIAYFRAYRTLATTTAGRQRLKDMLAGRLAVPGVEIMQHDRWRIVTALLALGDVEAERMLDDERSRDTGDDSRKQAYIAEAARADAATKRRYFADYLNNRSLPEDWIEGSLGPFNSFNQSPLTQPYLRPALEALPQVKRERKIFFVLSWLNAFIGGQQSEEALNDVHEFMKSNKIDHDLELKVLEVEDELERTVRIRNKYVE
ncbi:MAG: ERAP1-like C-terminal domain-containing protein [Blastocatellia bacterium]|nr:ERAP1-like C-terminal domain-containing protein [Blastocatellia bacterium]